MTDFSIFWISISFIIVGVAWAVAFAKWAELKYNGMWNSNQKKEEG